jgi:hypothetical protein
MFSKGMVCVIVALFLSFRVGGLPVVALFYSLRFARGIVCVVVALFLFFRI